MRTCVYVALGMLLGFVSAAPAQGQCCSGYSAVSACSGAKLTRSRWCVQDNVQNRDNALPAAFCKYGDTVVTTLEDVFNIQAKGVFEFQLDAQTGGAHTGTSCGQLGAGVAYDAFTGSAYGAPGFWGYLLSLHEAINVWTGMSSPGWPTDWWADHQSAFPNLMDFHIMEKIGKDSGDQNLIKAAAAQKKRFYPGGDSADAKVVALDNVFAAMPNGDGFAGFSEMFALQSGDGVKWDALGVPNPDVKRSEYVVAYMSLAARQRVLSILQGPGPNGGGDICNNKQNPSGDQPYTCSAANIDRIATAHCALAANGKPSADSMQFRSGKYTNIASGPCGDKCPAECACDAEQHCVAGWLGAAAPAAGSGGAGGRGGTGGTGGTGGSAARAGSAGAAGKAGTGGAASPEAGKSGGDAAGRAAAGSGGAAGRAKPDPDAGASTEPEDDAGCDCHAPGRPAHDMPVGLLAFALVLLVALRRRQR
ncbi:MAG TPA: MYXO-CTERM sorting domain-containing protein [Polyangiales bacterium]|nr:MYXO-CTERM sorting domain-containing protein [Polyangiales bacterium]